MFEEALMNRLLNKAPIQAILDSDIYFAARPPSSDMTSLVMNIASDAKQYNHDAADGLQEVRVRMDFRGVDYKTVKSASRAVLFEMEQQDERMGVHFEEGHKLIGHDAPRETLGGGTEVFRYTMDIMVPFRPA